jgi:PAS domain S-box-containing protein
MNAEGTSPVEPPGGGLRHDPNLIADLDAIVWEADARTMTFTFVSEGVGEILGYTASEWLAEPRFWVDHLHPDDRELAVARLARAATSGARFDSEYRFFAKDGSIVWLRDLGHAVKDVDGHPLLVRGLMTEIGERTSLDTSLRQSEQQIRQAESQRAEAEERYRALIEQNPTITYLAAVEGPVTTLYISPQTTEVLGYTPQDWYDAPHLWTDIVHPDDRERSKIGSSDLTQDAVYRMFAKDGRMVWIHDQARLIADEAGRPKYWQGVLVDITEQRRAEELSADLTSEREATERLRAADEMKNTFLQAVSHDLRTPLAAILGLAVTLEREDLNLDTDETRDMARRIAQNARKLDGIVSDLLDLDRLSRGILEPFFESVDVSSLVRELVGNFQPTTDRHLSLHTEPARIPADVAMVERIVENLLGNAAKHTPPNARIWVRVTGDDDGALIVVEDDGPGVPADERERIFEDFRQGSGHASGAGVGLALVARFAALHDGRAWVEDRPGGGASFRVFLSANPVAIRRVTGANEAAPDDGRPAMA